MRKIILIIFVFCMGGLVYTSCTKKKFEKPVDPSTPAPTCDAFTTTMSYSIHIKPILVNNCGTNGCHNPVSKFGGWDLSACVPTASNGVQACGLSGQLVAAVTGNTAMVNQPMPIGGKLQPCEISRIKGWVSAGCPDN